MHVIIRRKNGNLSPQIKLNGRKLLFMLPEITNRLKTIQAITVSHALNWQIYKNKCFITGLQYPQYL